MNYKTPVTNERWIDTLIDNLKQLCEYKGITMKDLCDGIHVGRNYFNPKVRKDIQISTMKKICDFFEIENVDLLLSRQYTAKLKYDYLTKKIAELEEAKKGLEKVLDTPVEE